jgi:hypothetical protein
VNLETTLERTTPTGAQWVAWTQQELALADLAYQDTRWQLRTADPARKDELLRALVHLVQTDPAAFGVLAAYRKLWRRWDSNPRPPACKAGALAN